MSRRQQYYVIGAGGHAKVIVSAIELSGGEVACIYDDDPEKQGLTLAGVPIQTPCRGLQTAPPLPTVLGIGNNSARSQISSQYDLDWATIIHPNAIIDKSVAIGRGTVVMAGAIIQAGARIGEHCIVNTAATIDHDCVLHDFCHVAPGANIAGHCELGRGVFIGIGACLVPSIRVGNWSTVGAGGVVVADLPAEVVATGVPARTQRD